MELPSLTEAVTVFAGGIIAAANPSEPVPVVITEGRVSRAHRKIVYPGIDSCLTVTLSVLGSNHQSALIGGHFVVVPNSEQIPPEQAVEKLNELVLDESITSFAVIGDEGWTAKQLGIQWPMIEGDSMRTLAIMLALKGFGIENVWYRAAQGDLSVSLQEPLSPPFTLHSGENPLNLNPAFDDFISWEQIQLELIAMEENF